jgi:hypothetical protein
MIFNIDNFTRLEFTDQWIIQKRTKIEKGERSGQWSELANKAYYSDIGHCLRKLTTMQVGAIGGEFHRDDIDVLVSGLNRIEGMIKGVLDFLVDAKPERE